MLKQVFFANKFYEAPEGHTPMQFCAQCNINHDTCSGCPHYLVDMSQAKEIEPIPIESCHNYVAPASGGKYYYSRGLCSNMRKAYCRKAMCYCIGEDIDGWAKTAMSLDEYASGMLDNFNDLRANMCSKCEYNNKHDCDQNIECMINCMVNEIKHTHFCFNNNHFDIEISEDIWNQCVDIIRKFNNTAYNYIVNNSQKVLADNIKADKFYTDLPANIEVSKYYHIIPNIFYATTNVSTGMFKEELYNGSITFEYFARYGKDSHVFTQQHFTAGDYIYEIPENIAKELCTMLNKVDEEIDNIIQPLLD